MSSSSSSSTIEMKTKFACYACKKEYTTNQNLQLHYVRQPLCNKWNNLDKKLNDCIETKIKSDKNNKNIVNKCLACKKIFSNLGNLNKHTNNSLTCKKWIILQDMQHFKPLFPKDFQPFKFNNELDIDVNTISLKESYGCSVDESYKELNSITKSHHESFKLKSGSKNGHKIEYKLMNAIKKSKDEELKCIVDVNTNYKQFIAPKYKLNHIIWNLFLIDKEFKLTKDIIDENNINYIIAILPNKNNYNKIINKNEINVEHTVLEYKGNNMQMDIKRFDEECINIEKYRKLRQNIFVFCNNGYQRSLPFLCYYLTKFHNDEVPSIEKAIDIILPQVDKDNYSILRNKYITNITLLFDKNNF